MKKKLLMMVFLVHLAVIAAAQRPVTGKVTNAEDGTTIPGVNILVKGTTIGTVTDLSGSYKLQVPASANTLVFSLIGMKSAELSVPSSGVLDVIMEPDVMNLDGVVVTAMGIKRETKALGYSVQSVQGDELTRSNESNVIQSLSAKAAGIQVIGSAGTPGASSKILIRGNATITGNNQPLIVVDGVPIDNQTLGSVAGDYPYNDRLTGVPNSNRAIDINPDDIESVSILKGPAAAALYGVRAGAGAIVYTTKRGTAGKGLNIEYSINSQISKVSQLPELQDTYAQGYPDENGMPVYDVADYGPDQLFNTADDISWGTSNSWGPKLSELGLTPVDNAGKFFQTATSYTHNLSISGGSEQTLFRLSLSRLDENGVVPNTSFTRTSVRLTGDHVINPRIKVGGTANYILSGGTKAQNGSNISGVMLGLLRTPASFDLLNPDGTYKYPTGQQRQFFFLYDNPYWSVYENPFTDEITRMLGNVYATIQPWKWLDITYRLGTDVYTDQRKMIYAIGSNEPPEPVGEVWENIKRFNEIYSDLLVTASHDFTEKFKGKILLGNNLNTRTNQDLFSRGRRLSIPNYFNLNNASNLYSSETTDIERTAALFFDLEFEYNSLLYLSLTGRNEWASTFGREKNNFFYPSASLSFVFSELLNDTKVLSFGKLRLAYAQSGINPPTYSSITYYASPFITDGFTNGLNFPYLGLNGFGYSTTMGNPALKPERVAGNEIGLDLRFFNGRIGIDMTWYYQKTTEAIITRPLASSTGFAQIYSNYGELENKGIEAVLTLVPVKTKSFQWELATNFSRNKNEVLKLAPGVDEVEIEVAMSEIGSYAIVGEPYGVFYGTKWKRNSQGQLVINPNTGLPLVEDLRANLGNPYPDWLLGLRNTLSYKGIELTALIDVREGGMIHNGTYGRLNRLGRSLESADREHNYVIPGVLADEEGNPTPVQNTIEISAIDYFQGYLGDGGAAEEQFVQDGSWIRLREIGLSYRLKTSGFTKYVQYLEFNASGRNLWVKTDYTGVDPETSLLGAASNLSGFDYFNMPGSKSYSFGLKVGF